MARNVTTEDQIVNQLQVGDDVIEYVPYSEEDAEEDAKASRTSEIKQIPAGDSRWRFLPKLKGQKSIFQTVWQHYIKGDGDQNAFVFACVEKMPEIKHDPTEVCPACETMRSWKTTGISIDSKKSRDFEPRMRVFANAISFDEPDKVVILSMPGTVYQKLLRLRRNSDTGGDFCDPMKGFDIIISREGEGLKTRYEVNGARNATPLENPYLIMQQHNLDQLTKLPSAEDVYARLDQIAEEQQQIAARGAAPARRGALPAQQAAPRGLPASAPAARGPARPAPSPGVKTVPATSAKSTGPVRSNTGRVTAEQDLYGDDQVAPGGDD